MKVKEYNIHHGAIRWRISTCKRHIREFLLAITIFFRYSHFKIGDLENVGQGQDLQPLTVEPFDGKYLTSYLMAIVLFDLSLTVFEILMFHMFDLEYLGQGHR